MRKVLFLAALVLACAKDRAAPERPAPPPEPKAPAAPPATAGGPIPPGTPAPDFEIVAHDGQTVKLSALRGKAVVLYFYPKDDTPG